MACEKYFTRAEPLQLRTPAHPLRTCCAPCGPPGAQLGRTQGQLYPLGVVNAPRTAHPLRTPPGRKKKLPQPYTARQLGLSASSGQWPGLICCVCKHCRGTTASPRGTATNPPRWSTP